MLTREYDLQDAFDPFLSPRAQSVFRSFARNDEVRQTMQHTHTRSMLWLAAGAAAIAAGMAVSRKAHTRRMQRVRSEPLTRWENEGGAVPVAENRTAAQVSPTTEESYGDETNPYGGNYR